MMIVKVNKELAIKAKNGELYSLRKIAIMGVAAIGLSTALITTTAFITKEVKYNIEMEQIEDLRTAAEKIEEMGNKANIEIKGENYFIPEEIENYADAKEDLIEAKRNSDQDNIQKYEEELKEASKNIYDISKQIIKDTAEPTFKNPEAGEIKLDVNESSSGVTATAKQYNEYGNTQETKILEGDFVHYATNNDISAQQLIERMPETLDSGEGIKIK